MSTDHPGTPEESNVPEEGSAEELQGAFDVFWRFVKRTLSLKEGIDRQSTMDGIIQDVDFRGHTAWILVCSILIASIGLGSNNIPIIVGAMLISPLMGPILGIGLAAGTNDFDLLKRSITNLGVALTISVLISTLYFLLIPIPEVTPELMDRKTATFLAIGVAFFGGSAGIIAGSRPIKSNVFPGMAIATALMPPLCTVGYGLATFQWDFFFGALYLFFINSVFIALPTYLYIRFVRFPLKQFVDPRKEKRIRRYILVFLVIVVIPSGLIFYQVLQESFFNRNVNRFISTMKAEMEDTDSYVNFFETVYSDSLQIVRIGVNGEPLEPSEKARYEFRLKEYDLDVCRIKWLDGLDVSAMLNENLALSEKQQLQDAMTEQANELESLREALAANEQESQALEDFSKELSLFLPEVERASYAEVLELNATGVQDTIKTVMIWWADTVSDARILDSEKRLERWLTYQLRSDDIRVWNMSSPSNGQAQIGSHVYSGEAEAP